MRAQLASIPQRKHMLPAVLESLVAQFDEVFVALNGYNYIPDFVVSLGVEYAILNNSTGDAAKFYNIEQHSGYLFTCDDDLVYPSGYAKYMISKIEKYHRPISLHGKIYNRHDINFLRPSVVYKALDRVRGDHYVDVPGTGVLAWHSDHLRVQYDDFKTPNMADCWFAKICHDQGVRPIVAAHSKHYLKYMRPKDTMWIQEKRTGCKRQTQLLKTFLS